MASAAAVSTPGVPTSRPSRVTARTRYPAACRCATSRRPVAPPAPTTACTPGWWSAAPSLVVVPGSGIAGSSRRWSGTGTRGVAGHPGLAEVGDRQDAADRVELDLGVLGQ